jgi:hypothetical protein
MRNEMTGILWRAAAFAALAAAICLASPSGLAADNPRAFSPLVELPVIAVAEMLDVKPQVCPGPEARTCENPVRFRIEQILRDRDGLGLAPGEFEVRLPQWVGTTSADHPFYIWSDYMFRAGQRYIVASRARGALDAALRDPDMIVPVTPPAEAIADARLILASANAPAVEQAETAALAIRGNGVRSRLLADYVAALLQTGHENETATLFSALNSAPTSVFSDDAKSALLFRLSAAVRSKNDADDLLLLFLRLSVRYFAASGEQTAGSWSSLSRIQGKVLEGLLLVTAGSDRARGALRDVTRSEGGDELRTKLRILLADYSISLAQKAKLQGLLDMMGR